MHLGTLVQELGVTTVNRGSCTSEPDHKKRIQEQEREVVVSLEKVPTPTRETEHLRGVVGLFVDRVSPEDSLRLQTSTTHYIP